MYKTIHEVTLESLKKNCTLIHYFGLGFIQIKLGDMWRIHVYTDKLPAIVDEEDVHNHRYDFKSRILHGTFKQELFEVIAGDTHTLEDESCKKDGGSINPPRPCSLKKLFAQEMRQGSEYVIERDTYHRVSSKNAITLLERSVVEKEFAQVIREKDGLKICPFSKVVPEDELWGIVEDILAEV